jgi:alanine-synthesizing transaminase
VSVLYSHRLPWSQPPNLYSERISALRKSAVQILDLSRSNPTLVGLSNPDAQIAAALAGVDTLVYSPDPTGEMVARQSISRYYAQRGARVEPERIVLTASTSEAYSHLFKLICDSGDEILVPVPSYPLFEYLAGLECVRVVPYHLRYDGAWHIDFADLRQRITNHSKVVIVVNPNNPTGSFLKRPEAEELLELASEYEMAVISDEVFADYAFASDPERVDTLSDSEEALVFCLNGLSKSTGMPQLKLGWIVVSGPGLAIVDALHHLELILDTYLSVGTPVQRALPALFRIGESVQAELRNRVLTNLDILRVSLRDSPVSLLNVEAGWSAILQIPRTRGEQEWLIALLEEEHVIAQPGFFFDMPSEAFLVLSLITPSLELETGVFRLLDLVARYT